MVLADPEHIQTYLIGVLDLLEQIAHAIGRACRDVRLTDRRRETVNANFHVAVRNKGPDRIVPGRRASTCFAARRGSARGSTSAQDKVNRDGSSPSVKLGPGRGGRRNMRRV